jgi:6-phosphogluconate dehydrogenase
MDLGVSIPTIAEAVMARSISDRKAERVEAADVLMGPAPELEDADKLHLIADVRAALYCSKICSYAQGFTLLQAADKEYGFGLRIKEVAGIWRAGCIIRAAFLNDITAAIGTAPDLANLLMADQFRDEIAERQAAWRGIVRLSAEHGVPTPGFATSLAYYDSYRTARLPANLIQAQRDYFGAHTYERLDKPVGETFHTEWADRAQSGSPSSHPNPADGGIAAGG